MVQIKSIKMTSFGLSSSLRYFEYEFDSLDATTSNSQSAASTDWPTFSMERPLNDLAGIKVLEVQIPFSFYVFSRENNTFLISILAGLYSVAIPVGNYTYTSLQQALQDALNSATGSSFTVTYSITTGKYTIVNNAAADFTLKFGAPTGDDGSSNPRYFLGFNGGNSTSSGASLTSQNVALVTGPNYLYLNSEALGTLVQLYLPSSAELSQGGLGPEMAKIPINCNPGGVIFWQDPDPTKWFDVESLFTLQNVDFYFTLGNYSLQKPLRFNGLGFSIKLGIVVNSEQRTDTTVYSGAKRVRAVY
jgi:hypothetical protein